MNIKYLTIIKLMITDFYENESLIGETNFEKVFKASQSYKSANEQLNKI